jgi:calcineurin-like phosphoesterase family protein
MGSIWVTSDTHFNHASMLDWGLSGRPEFNTVEEMNETIIERWNSVVQAGDKVYHLGDVFFGSKDEFKSLWPRLKGSKRLVVGNHDDIRFLSSGGFFKKVTLWRYLKELGFMLTHVPIDSGSIIKAKNSSPETIVLHGHLHRNGSPSGRYYNVCTENHNYYPLNLEELSSRLSYMR